MGMNAELLTITEENTGKQLEVERLICRCGNNTFHALAIPQDKYHTHLVCEKCNSQFCNYGDCPFEKKNDHLASLPPEEGNDHIVSFFE